MAGTSKKDRSQDAAVSHGEHTFVVAIAKADFGFQPLKLDDAKVVGRQVLEAAGFRPPEDHLLFQVLSDGAIEERRLDESVALTANGGDRFIVFRGDRSFRVEIDGRRFEWGTAELTGLIAKQMVGADPTCTGLWLERRDEPDRFIENTDVVQLADRGLEKLYTRALFPLSIEGKELFWPKSTITTEQIAGLGGWGPALGVQQIDLTTNEAHTLKAGEVVDLNDLKTFAKKIGWRRG